MRKFTSKIWLFTLICVSVRTTPTQGKMRITPVFVFVPSIFTGVYTQSPYLGHRINYQAYYMPQIMNPYYDPYADTSMKPDSELDKERVKPLSSVSKNDPSKISFEKDKENTNRKVIKGPTVTTEIERLTTYKIETMKPQNSLDVKPTANQLYGQNNPIVGDYYPERQPPVSEYQNAFNQKQPQWKPTQSTMSSGDSDASNIKPGGSRQPVTMVTRGSMSTEKTPSDEKQPNLTPEEKSKLNALAISDFGINIMKVSSTPAENFAISPYSIALVLAMVQQGAHGKAQDQISQALGLAPNASASVFRNFGELKSRSSSNILNIATNLFVSNLFQLEPEFKRNVLHNFNSQASQLDFQNSVDATNMINSWVASKTQNKIKDLIKPGAISPATKLVMANAIFYKGIWKTLFHPNATIPRQFNRARGDSVSIPFMRLRRAFPRGYDNMHKLQFVVLPFEGEEQSLMILLPDVGQSIDKVLLHLQASRLALYGKSTHGEVEIEIPKFTVKEDLDLDPVLRSLGVTDIFTPYLANLKGIGNSYGVSPEISTAVHSAMLSIDEQGATAAASTAFAAVALSYDEFETFRADRPFLAVLWDKQLNTALFLVRIENPTL